MECEWKISYDRECSSDSKVTVMLGINSEHLLKEEKCQRSVYLL